MGKIEQNKEMKRRAILDAAQRIFLSEGYVLSSMDKIASAAQVTKQTVYRYFPTKIDLFKATLIHMGGQSSEDFLGPLEHQDPQEALLGFAKAFVRFHLSDEHIATLRLLISESSKEPEITRSFMEVGPNDTDEVLTEFFSKRLNIAEPKSIIRHWTGMLLSLRANVLVGIDKPTDKEMDQHALEATKFLLAAIS